MGSPMTLGCKWIRSKSHECYYWWLVHFLLMWEFNGGSISGRHGSGSGICPIMLFLTQLDLYGSQTVGHQDEDD